MTPQFLYKFILCTLLISFIISCQEKTKNNESPEPLAQLNQIDSQEEKDWKEFDTMKTRFSVDKDAYYHGNFWYSRNVEEEIEKNRVRLARNYLHNYPNGSHYYDVLKYYFTYLLEPRYLKSDMSEEQRAFLTQERDNSLMHKQLRALPYDIEARDQRLREGDSLVNRFLQSDAPSEQKAYIEIEVLGRDMRMASEIQKSLNLKRTEMETNFWLLFGRQYWGSFIDRIELLLYKYPDYPKWPELIDSFIKIPTFKFLSPEITEYLWQHFYEVTDKPEMFEEYPVIAKTHKRAKETLKAIEDLKTFDETQPLHMQMIGMDGKKINLEDYRGKVVMLDFWDLRCAPCIQEMPHVQSLYEKYKDQGFEVIGICAAGEESQERVQEITGKQGATWPQVLDEASNAAVSYHSLYKIERLPTVWLLDKNGVIVDKHARGNRLEPLIRKYLELE